MKRRNTAKLENEHLTVENARISTISVNFSASLDEILDPLVNILRHRRIQVDSQHETYYHY